MVRATPPSAPRRPPGRSHRRGMSLPTRSASGSSRASRARVERHGVTYSLGTETFGKGAGAARRKPFPRSAVWPSCPTQPVQPVISRSLREPRRGRCGARASAPSWRQRGPTQQIETASRAMPVARTGAFVVLQTPRTPTAVARTRRPRGQSRLPSNARPEDITVEPGGLDDLRAEHPSGGGAATYVDKILRAPSPPTFRRAAHQVRAGDQPQDREGPRPHDPAVGARAGG